MISSSQVNLVKLSFSLWQLNKDIWKMTPWLFQKGNIPFGGQNWRIYGTMTQECKDTRGFSLPFYEMMHKGKAHFSHPFFMETFIIAAWAIWKQRNGLIFDNRPPNMDSWLKTFKDDCILQAHRFKSSFKTPFLSWLEPL